MSAELDIPEPSATFSIEQVEALSTDIVAWTETAPAQALVTNLDGVLALERWLKHRKMDGPMQTAARYMERAIGRHLGPAEHGKQRKIRTAIHVSLSDDPETDRTLRGQFRLIAEYWGDIVGHLPLTRAAALKIARRLRAGVASIEGQEPPKIHHARCEELIELSGPESVDVIVTDPPYADIDCYAELSKTAAVILRPGGLCWAMVGQTYLPEIMQALGRALNYHWAVAYLTPGGEAVQLWQKKVNTFWKPVLVYARPEDTPVRWFGDVARSDPNDDDPNSHPTGWAQSESGTADLVRRASEPGWVVCDPFTGAGTTAVVAAALGRAFIGCDSDADRVADARRRIGQ